MESETTSLFSHRADVFHGSYLPEKGALLAGYSALISAYQLEVPLPDFLAAISKKHKRFQKDYWFMYTPKHAPQESLQGHLVFALKYEGVNLSVLKALFKVVPEGEIEAIVSSETWGSYSRRIWFLYEWLMDKPLKLPDIHDTKINFVDVLDSKLQYTGPTRRSARHRVSNNLPGVQNFCPLIRRTETLDNFINSNLNKVAKIELKRIHPDLLMRAATFLLLKDSKASYAIEGENPPHNRAERWGKAIGQAGLHPLSHDELLRLQEIVIADFRYTHPGYRNEGGFIGDHDRATNQPIPVHISARHQDVPDLMDGLIETDNLLKEAEYHPVLAATVMAFGFVFIHPFEDGNGRIHRYIIHHALAENNFTPDGVVFPVSAVILERLKEYLGVLESYSAPRLKFIKWRPTQKNNVEVQNETIDLYRYFDATKQAEFLFSCIKETIEEVIPKEIDFLQKYDEMKSFIENYIEMPDRMVNLLIRFLQQENGVLSKRAQEKEFESLTQGEVQAIESKFKAIFYK